MIACPNCGNSLAPGVVQCARCGADFSPGSAWQPTDGAPRLTPTVPHAPWKLRLLCFFLIADAIFVGIHASLSTLPLASNYSFAQKAVTYVFVYTLQFLAAFVVGIVLSFAYRLIVHENASVSRGRIWMRALGIALVPAAILVYIAWWAARHPVAT